MLTKTNLHYQWCIGMAILLYCLISITPLPAKTFYYPSQLDSLEVKAEILKKNEKRLEFWLDEVWRFSEKDLSLALECLEKCDTLIPLTDDKVILGKYYYWRAWITFSLNPESQKDQLAIGDVDRGLQIFQQEKEFHWKAKAHLLSASIKVYKDRFDEAQTQLLQAQTAIAHTRGLQSDSLKVIAIANITMASIHAGDEGNIEAAKESLEEAYSIYESLQDSSRMASILQNMAQLEEPALAEQHFSRAYELLQNSNNHAGLGGLFHSRAQYYIYRFDTFHPDHQLLWNSLEALEQAAQVDAYPKADVYLMKGTNYYLMWRTSPQDTGKYLDAAKKAYLKAVAFAKEENNSGVMRHAVGNLGQICSGLGDCTEVINKMSESYHAIIDSSIRIAGLAQERQKQYEKRSIQEAARQRQQSIYWGSSILLFIVGSVSFSVYQRQKALQAKKEKEATTHKLEAEKNKAEAAENKLQAIQLKQEAAENKLEALRSQMSPHFFSNNLNIIDSYINLGEPEKASKHVIIFSRLCRTILNNSRRKMIELEEELELNRNYLNLEVSAFSGDLTYDMEVAPEIDTSLIKIPSMLLNPFIENAVKHGIKYKQAPGHLSVKVTEEEEETIKFVITDDGVGRARARQIKARKTVPDRQSYGTAIAEEQIHKMNGQLDIEDLQENGTATGTRVSISLPKSELI